LALVFLLFGTLLSAKTPEVNKDEIPDQFLSAPAGSKLPNGVQIWDVSQAMKALQTPHAYLWIDTRPTSLFHDGTLKPAIHLAYHKNEQPMTGADGPMLTKEKLQALIGGKSKVVFFCQGPKCHRSFNAALRAVDVWGIPASKVVWFRAGFPPTYKYIMSQPAYKKRAAHFIKGKILNR